MSTSCEVAIKHKDGSYESQYCHYDGDLYGVGRALLKEYKDIEQIKSLLKPGPIRTILGVVEYLETYTEDDLGAKKTQNQEEFQSFIDDSWAEYVYVFDEADGKWYWTFNDLSKLVELTDTNTTHPKYL